MQPARDGCDRLNRALRRAVQIELAVLPVRHRRARLERLVTGVRRDERFVEYERSLFEAGFDVAVLPLVRRLARGQTTLTEFLEVVLGPLQFGDIRGRWRLARLRRRPHPGVALGA